MTVLRINGNVSAIDEQRTDQIATMSLRSQRYPRNNWRPFKLVVTASLVMALLLALNLLGYPNLWRTVGESSSGLTDSDINDNYSKQNSEFAASSWEEALTELDDSPADGSQEIFEITGQEDSLLSVMSANLPDESSAIRVSQSLAATIQSSLGESFDMNTSLKPGRRYSLALDNAGNFLKATVELDSADVFHVALVDGALRSWKEDVVLEFKVESRTFKLTSSLIESILQAGETMEMALRLTSVFRWDIDFQSETVKGDTCKVLFERRYADDRPSGYGRILGAVYEGKKTGRKTAILFSSDYYDEKGVELKKNFLRSPLTNIRITSRYGARFHPVLRVWRKHNGVDYGAAVGTPVWSVANGTVVNAGWHNGYGNNVWIKHDNGYESRYGHLSRILVRKGQRVKQRQRVGLVGMTGIATGPHLDFQLLVAGKHVNPLSVKMIRDPRSVPSPLRERFEYVAQDRLRPLRETGTDRRTGPRISAVIP